MKNIEVKIFKVKVFTKNPRFGNLAGVVINTLGLAEKDMRAIAKKVGASETAFVFPSKKGDFRLRWFTPNTEVGMCIHATIAAAAVLKKQGFVSKNIVNFKTINTGLYVKFVKNKVYVGFDNYETLSLNVDQKVILDELGIKKSEIVGKPGVIKIFRDRELMVEVKNLKVLESLKSDMKTYTKVCKKIKVTGISIFCKQTFKKGNSVHTREFAPLYGYLEDPLCGMAAGAIAKYLRVKKDIKIEQGNFLKLPGVIEVLRKGNKYFIGGDYRIMSS